MKKILWGLLPLVLIIGLNVPSAFAATSTTTHKIKPKMINGKINQYVTDAVQDNNKDDQDVNQSDVQDNNKDDQDVNQSDVQDNNKDDENLNQSDAQENDNDDKDISQIDNQESNIDDGNIDQEYPANNDGSFNEQDQME